MLEVLTDGQTGSNLRRRERLEDPIPTSFNIFELKQPKPSAPYVHVANIRSIQCVTYIPNVADRLDPSHTGYYINIFPWIHWKRGKIILEKDIHEGPTARKLTEKEQRLRNPYKPAGNLDDSNIMRLSKQSDNRCALLRKLGLNVKQCNNPSFVLED